MANILDEPIDSVAVVQLLMICFGKETLLSEGSEGQEPCQAFTEVAKNG